MGKLTRKRVLCLLGGPVLAGAGLGFVREAAGENHDHAHAATSGTSPAPTHGSHADAHGGAGHAGFTGSGIVDPAVNGFDPSAMVRDFDWGKTRRLASGRMLREWELVAVDMEFQVAPGVSYAGWAYNGRIPGPTLRAREVELLRIRFANS